MTVRSNLPTGGGSYQPEQHEVLGTGGGVVQSATTSQWQPISTAPKDGTAVWIVVDGRPYIGYFDPDDAPWATPQWFVKATYRRRDLSNSRTDEIIGCYGFDVSPTHWMPLPTPPSPEGTGR